MLARKSRFDETFQSSGAFRLFGNFRFIEYYLTSGPASNQSIFAPASCQILSTSVTFCAVLRHFCDNVQTDEHSSR
jgi:hypothetical protein